MGVVTDLTKFFNTVPRMAIPEIMDKFGIPRKFAEQWVDFLHKMKRVLFFNNCISRPSSSTCGVPEGDPLSVVLSVLIS